MVFTKAKKAISKSIAGLLVVGFVVSQGFVYDSYAASASATVKPVDFLNVRTGASASNSIVTKVYTGQKVDVLDYSNGWVKISVNGNTGWVNGKYLNITSDSNSSEESKSSATDTASKIDLLLDMANKQKGKPYKYGSAGPNSFDCSGFTSYVYKNALGITLPRVSRDQAGAGTYVSRENLKAGDLVFFGSRGRISHVGMYIGGGQFIHSPQTGDVVKVSRMDTGNYSKRFITARRIVQ
ncbi:MAG: C40 family peptidase [Clostridioides sp.]|jgi:cell wall-associated NlpC family hydrolase|nr:C40 family peptidase [Clostridioides sp.]